VGSNRGNNKADQEYVYDSESALTLKHHASRTAEKQAAFFLPYLQPRMSLLDCGCGSGSITLGLAKAVEPGQVTGVDMVEVEIDRARERSAEAKIENIHFEVGNVLRLISSDNSYDAVFSHNVLEHIPEPSKAVKEMYRVLKPGGIIGIRDINYGGHIIAPKKGVSERAIYIMESAIKEAGGHPRLGPQLGRLLHEAGFEVINMSASYDVYGDLKSRKFLAQVLVSRFSEEAFIDRVTRSGAANVEEAESIREYFLAWQDRPDAFAAEGHCEAIGRKA
jgi:ubiquinone/menaquinone biosynthesis C-methylase UbiE